MNATRLFDTIRKMLGRGLTQAEVDRINVDLGEGLSASDDAVRIIKTWEGCKLTAYPDPASGGDPWTVGWGATGPKIKRGVVWTQQQADDALAEHVALVSDQVWDALDGAPTTQAQFDALVAFTYNVGIGNLKNSTLLRRHKEGNYEAAAIQFGYWRYASGKVMPGLVKRRSDEARLYRRAA